MVAIVDVPLQMFQFNRSLRMTRQELRDEAKESEGSPETKRRIRQMQQQIARRRMMQKVPGADVVIVNPTHFAVALKYDPKRMRAPRVLAKGANLVALNIRRIAEEHRVPVFESPRLARALYKSAELDREIPAGLYMAVAQVLSYVFRVRNLNPTAAARMSAPSPSSAPSTIPNERAYGGARLRRIRAPRSRRAAAGDDRAGDDGAAAAGLPARRVLHLQHLAVAGHSARRHVRAPCARVRDLSDGAARRDAAAARL